jgi:hypothetical protein
MSFQQAVQTIICLVKTIADHLARWWSYVDQSDPEGCWPWTGGKGTKGYGMFNMPSPDDSTRWRPIGAHRWGFAQLIRPLKAKELVCHTCDNPPCCRPDHWFAGTAAENNADRMRKGRTIAARGEAARSARLTADRVRQIRLDYASGERTQQSLADEHGVRLAAIWSVIHRRTWTHVD